MSNDFAHIAFPSAWIPRCQDLTPDVPCLSAAEFLARREDEAWVIVDCRPLRERVVSILPGALSLRQFRFQRARHADKLWLLYCTIGLRSGIHVRRREPVHQRRLPGGRDLYLSQ